MDNLCVIGKIQIVQTLIHNALPKPEIQVNRKNRSNTGIFIQNTYYTILPSISIRSKYSVW